MYQYNILEQSIRVLGEMPNFVDSHQFVAFLKCFLELQCHSRPMKCSLGVAVMAGLLLKVVSIGTAKWEHQFTLSTVREDGVV
jgi:hypothetical protein